MQTVLVTGAAGGIGTRLRKLLDGVYPRMVWSDIRKPSDLASHQTFVAADIADLAQVEKLLDGVDGVVHLGGESIEQSWDRILRANIVGCYNLFEAAQRKKVQRVVFASSNHAVGFYPRQRKIGTDEPAAAARLEPKRISGGVLVQERDTRALSESELKVVSKRQPTREEIEGMLFAWKVAKHVKSNAIVFARDSRTLGVGAGQMSRVDSVKIAVMKAQESLAGSVVASDAFFPFPEASRKPRRRARWR